LTQEQKEVKSQQQVEEQAAAAVSHDLNVTEDKTDQV